MRTEANRIGNRTGSSAREQGWDEPRSLACLGLTFLIANLLATMTHAQRPGFNYDESRVPTYTLPEVLETVDGTPITTRQQWQELRRPQLVALFEEHVYGAMAPRIEPTGVDIEAEDTAALGGKAIRREVAIRFGDEKTGPLFHLLVYLPRDASADRPVPLFLGCNFQGNHAVHPSEPIRLAEVWDASQPNKPCTAEESARGAKASRWPVETIVARGYGVATIYYGDIDPDFDDGFKNGVHALFPELQQRGDNWTSIGAWAWGLSRVLDYLETEPRVDAKRVAVIGHSRLGKTALWAGAHDERFAMVVSNNSGCGGAALARREFGETVARINSAFPHWFCENHKQYGPRVSDLPVDQHELIALIAPRPVYVASASKDLWADPRGEFLACVGADPVYRLLGTEGLPSHEFPEVNTPIQGRVGYHLRDGEHDITPYDWDRYLDFADRHLHGGSSR